ncbi:MAG: ABC transporter substrate-binding protein [Chloroflexi bacterium]|nr:ABC transporter substrate-binding protein [Chloroflexota bacterium]
MPNVSSVTSTTAPRSTIAAPTDLITPGTLTVGSYMAYPPQEYIDATTNQATGFDIDLITAIARYMGLKTNIVATNFGSIIDNLAAEHFDVVISAVTITADRQKKVDFVPYLDVGESLLVQKGNPRNVKSITDLCGMGAAVKSGTVEQTDLQMASEDCIKGGRQKIDIMILPDQQAVIQLLAARRVVATYQDSPVTDYYNKENPGRFEVGGPVVNVAAEGIAIRKGDTSTLTAVQKALTALKKDGTYTALIQKWGLMSGAITMVDNQTAYA